MVVQDSYMKVQGITKSRDSMAREGYVFRARGVASNVLFGMIGVTARGDSVASFRVEIQSNMLPI